MAIINIQEKLDEKVKIDEFEKYMDNLSNSIENFIKSDKDYSVVRSTKLLQDFLLDLIGDTIVIIKTPVKDFFTHVKLSELDPVLFSNKLNIEYFVISTKKVTLDNNEYLISIKFVVEDGAVYNSNVVAIAPYEKNA